jgi:hypothetical protein
MVGGTGYKIFDPIFRNSLTLYILRLYLIRALQSIVTGATHIPSERVEDV